MTWIVGAATSLGYAVGISDIRVTFADGSERDCLQKIYPMGRFTAAGFAGSVRIGFAMLEALAHLLHPEPPPNQAFIPEEVVNCFCPLARDVFRQAPRDEQALHSHILLLSADPAQIEGWPWGRCSVHVFRSPDFTPEAANIGQVVSIGYGSVIPAYTEMLASFTAEPLSLLRGEMMGGQMGHLALTIAIQGMVEANPVPGVSQHAHVCVVRRNSVAIGPNDHEQFMPTGERIPFRMPAIATSWIEFSRIASEEARSPLAAVC